MLKEFREFISKGNVLDLAVGIIIGGAFGKIVASLVADVLMPMIGLFAGKINFSNLFLALDFKTYENLEAAKKASAPLLMYGNFLQTILDFLIVGFAIFMIVKAANKAKRPAPSATVPAATKECPYCLTAVPLKASRCAHCTSDIKGTP